MFPQSFAVRAIADNFGEPFFYLNKNGNPAISKDVLDAFNNITKDTVVWMKKRRAWRLREQDDPPGRTVNQ